MRADREHDLFVCRARFNNTWHPGKAVGNACNISYGGSEYVRRSFQLLNAPPRMLRWVSRGDFESRNDNAAVREGRSSGIEAGRETRTDRYGGRLLVCRASRAVLKDERHSGKIVDTQCMYGYDGDELRRGSYEVLEYVNRTERGQTVSMARFLPPEQLRFTIAGRFDAARAVSSETRYARDRPLDDATCEDRGLLPMAGAAPAQPQLAEIRKSSGPRRMTLAPAQTAGRTLFEPDLIEGEVFRRAGIDNGSIEGTLVSRLLRLETPHMVGPDVLALQIALGRAGWPLPTDGFFGPRTDAALRHFQRSNDLVEDGLFGPATQARLGL